jgi:hypothetical protein
MYETPTLIEVGRAEEVILGIASWGDDLDGHIIIQDSEFAPEIDVAILLETGFLPLFR